MSQSLELSENRKSAQFTVENESNEKMAIELTVKERRMNSDGKEELPPTSELSIFPPQMIIPPKEKRTVRVMWNGPGKISSEKSFRVIAEQLPLDVDKKKKGTGIQMLMKYMAAFYVTPPDAKADLGTTLISSLPGKLVFKVTNSGMRHQIIYKPKLTFRKGSNKIILGTKELKGFAGENILSKSERFFSIEYPGQIPEGSEVSLKLED